MNLCKIIYLIAFVLLQTATAATNYGRCVNPNREPANCIELEECTQLYQLLITPNLSENDRIFLGRSQCGYYNGKVLICCPQRYITAATPNLSQNRPQPKPPQASNQGMRMNTSNNLLPNPPQCGASFMGRIVGGNVTHIYEYPWMALIAYTKPGNEIGHHCGGTLINNRYVLTAAHCVTGKGIPEDWTLSGVRLGEWDTSTDPDCEVDARGKRDCAPAHVDVSVSERIPHPQYNSNERAQLNDIALLRLARAVTFGDFIQPICLPSAAAMRADTFTNAKMDVAGWGRTESSATSSLKLKAEVSVWDLANCQRTYAPQNLRLESSQLCAGGVEGIDSCRGDSGGPLIITDRVNNGEYFFLAGVVSFGPTPCGLNGWPGVYTRVGHYVDWIQNTIRA